MTQKGGVDGRNVVENESATPLPRRWPLVLGTPTRFYLYSQHVRQDNIPDGGIPTVGMPGFYSANAAHCRSPAARCDRENYYGSKGRITKRSPPIW